MSLTVCLVNASFAETERIAWMVEIATLESPCLSFSEIEHVTKGLPRTRKARRFEAGMSRVRLRSLNAETTWFLGGVRAGFGAAEIERSALKTWYMKAEVLKRDG